MDPTTPPQPPAPSMPQMPDPAQPPMPDATPPAAPTPPAQPGFTPAVMPAPVKSGSNKIVLIVVFVVILVLLVGGAYVVLGALGKKTTKTNSSTTTPTTKTTTKTATTALACLVQDDYKWFEFDKQPASVTFDDTYNPEKFTNNATDDMFFKPDSTEETSLSSVYDDWADFAKHAENKQWKFRLEGSTYGKDTALAASKKLANDRAQKVISELVKRGVPANRIVIDPPHDYSNEPQTSSMVEIYRRVQVVIDPNCTTTATPTSTSGR